MKDKITWLIAAVIYLAILYSLVRPGSKGTVIIGNIGSLLTDLVLGASGATYDKTTGKWKTNSLANPGQGEIA